jgi:DNA-binding MarR family transcriptional regulator
VGLLDRAEGAGLITRRTDPDNRRVVRVRLTPAGSARLERLSAVHAEELRRFSTQRRQLWMKSNAGAGGPMA